MAKMKLTEVETHPAGWYVMTISDIQEETMKYGPTYKVCLLSGEGAVTDLMSAKYTNKSKFGAFVAAVLGEQPEDLDTDDLIERKVCVLVSHNTAGYAQVDEYKQVKKKAKKDPFDE